MVEKKSCNHIAGKKLKIRLLLVLMVVVASSFFGKVVYGMEVDSRASIMVEAKTGEILYENNSEEKLPIASVSKIVTMYEVLTKIHNKEGSWKDIVPISDYLKSISHDSSLGGTVLKDNYNYTVEDLYKAMIMESSNSATMALGEWITGSTGNQEPYIKKANDFLTNEVGLKDYEYVSASGLENVDIEGYHVGDVNGYNKFSAKDVAKIAKKLINTYPEILETSKKVNDQMSDGTSLHCGTKVYEGNSEYDASLGIDGLKTGFTNIAGNTFVGTGEKNGMRLITVTLNSKNYAKDTKEMMRYGYDNFELKGVKLAGSAISGSKLKVVNGKQKTVSVSVPKEATVVVPKNTKTKVKVKISNKLVTAPIKKGDVVANVEVVVDGSKGTIIKNEEKDILGIKALSDVSEKKK